MPISLFRKIIFLFLISFQANAQKFCVYFKDKPNTAFNPYEYFDEKAIERRIQHSLPLYDYYDLPVNEQYINAVSRLADSVKVVSRWLNCAIIYQDDERIIAGIKDLPFVKSVEPVLNTQPQLTSIAVDDEKEMNLLIGQISTLDGIKFHQAGFTGKGIRIAVFDAGFKGVDKNDVFKKLRDNGQILKTFDFVKKKEFVYDFSAHGTAVLSCIAGTYNGIPVGLALDAEFLLGRTEHPKKEPLSEEENWLAAAEWADKNGAQIISSSLGYTKERYYPEQMNGHTSFVSTAARIATRKGMLVISSAGNEGDSRWKTIVTPADVDSVLSIGGIDPKTGIHTSFSSFGPTADFKMKPNVTAYGHVYAAEPDGMGKTQGTSFSCPLISGFAACAMQARTGLTNMQLFKAIEQSATLYPYFDYAHGYGMPQAGYFLKSPGASSPSFTLKKEDNFIVVAVNEKIYTDPKSAQQLFFHFKDKDQVLLRYTVVDMEHQPAYTIYAIPEGAAELMVFFNGYTETLKL